MKYVKALIVGVALITGATFQSYSQNIAVNDNGAAAASNAILDVDVSTNNKGVLIPRLTTAEITAMGSVTTGMLVYDETINDFKYFNGSNWVTIGSTYVDGNGIYTGSGALSGNTVISQAANTLGFTSSVVNAFSVDGTTFSIDASNNRVGIGTSSPSAELDVIGSMQLTDGTQGANKILISDAWGNASWSSNITIAGTITTTNIRTVTTTYTALSTDHIIVCDAAGGSFTITLPTAASSTGKQYIFKKLNSGNTVTVKGNGSELIDGSNTVSFTAAYKYITVVSNGVKWLIITSN